MNATCAVSRVAFLAAASRDGGAFAITELAALVAAIVIAGAATAAARSTWVAAVAALGAGFASATHPPLNFGWFDGWLAGEWSTVYAVQVAAAAQAPVLCLACAERPHASGARALVANPPCAH